MTKLPQVVYNIVIYSHTHNESFNELINRIMQDKNTCNWFINTSRSYSLIEDAFIGEKE